MTRKHHPVRNRRGAAAVVAVAAALAPPSRIDLEVPAVSVGAPRKNQRLLQCAASAAATWGPMAAPWLRAARIMTRLQSRNWLSVGSQGS